MQKSTTEQKDGRMLAWTGFWNLYKRSSKQKKENPWLIRGVAQELAILGHELIKTEWVDFIPIFPELKGDVINFE